MFHAAITGAACYMVLAILSAWHSMFGYMGLMLAFAAYLALWAWLEARQQRKSKTTKKEG